MFDEKVLKEFCKERWDSDWNGGILYNIVYKYETYTHYHYTVKYKRNTGFCKRELRLAKTVYNKFLIEKRKDKINKIKMFDKELLKEFHLQKYYKGIIGKQEHYYMIHCVNMTLNIILNLL